MPNVFKPIFLLLGLFLGGKGSLALQTYPLMDQQSTSFPISQTELNRIAVWGDRIQQIIGDVDRFEIQSDDAGGQLFLKLVPHPKKGRASKPLTITLITESGLTQDLRLLPKPVAFQSILFKPFFPETKKDPTEEPTEDPKENATEIPLRLQPAIALLKAMVKNEAIPGYTPSFQEAANACPVIEDDFPTIDTLLAETRQGKESGEDAGEKKSSSCATPRPSPRDLKLTLTLIYKGGSFEGRVYTLTHQGSTVVHFNEQAFAKEGDVVLYLPQKTLVPQEETTLYVVSRRRS